MQVPWVIPSNNSHQSFITAFQAVLIFVFLILFEIKAKCRRIQFLFC